MRITGGIGGPDGGVIGGKVGGLIGGDLPGGEPGGDRGGVKGGDLIGGDFGGLNEGGRPGGEDGGDLAGGEILGMEIEVDRPVEIEGDLPVMLRDPAMEDALPNEEREGDALREVETDGEIEGEGIDGEGADIEGEILLLMPADLLLLIPADTAGDTLSSPVIPLDTMVFREGDAPAWRVLKSYPILIVPAAISCAYDSRILTAASGPHCSSHLSSFGAAMRARACFDGERDFRIPAMLSRSA
jgi:hypothetical protein